MHGTNDDNGHLLALGFVEVDDGEPSAPIPPRPASPPIPVDLYARLASAADLMSKSLDELVRGWLADRLVVFEQTAGIRRRLLEARARRRAG